MPPKVEQASKRNEQAALTESSEGGQSAMQFKRSIDISGQVFHRLTAVCRHHKVKSGNVIWKCRCECGSITYASATQLRSGGRVSCGCYQREQQKVAVTTHGMSNSGTYRSWSSMLSRCGNPKAPDYSRYGGRGIVVCNAWIESFENFLNDMGERPYLHTIGRIDCNAGYDKKNCRWESREQQAQNRSNTVWLSFNGETMPLSVLARRCGVSAGTITRRLKRGFSVDDSVKKPSRKALTSKIPVPYS